MSTQSLYRPTYNKSWALVIGINKYEHASPLAFARNDAEVIAETLKTKFGFPEENVFILLDEAATRDRIRSSYLRFTAAEVEQDDRIVVFFAGHGCTRTGKRGEVGYLVPSDGTLDDLSTLVRWDDLTRNSELIPAKHILFVMDACYGGLALHRQMPPGSSRFLKNMLQRYSRQVLTAGKADEPVADAGGPRAGHSIFTGHLLNALDGAAADGSGIISANAVMAYVVERVSKDPHSLQSPHFGFFDGDGDFIFAAPALGEADATKGGDADILLQVPAMPVAEGILESPNLVEQVKEYLSDSRYRIRLDDLISAEIRTASYELREEEFPVDTATVTTEDCGKRLRKYEAAISRLVAVTVLLGRWGTVDHKPLVERVLARLADGTEAKSGKSAWLTMRWYPLLFLMYSGGIAALSAHNYEMLATLLMANLARNRTGQGGRAAVLTVVQEILDLDRMEIFKNLPEHQRYFAPRSEYLFKTIQPQIEDLLFLGNSYEDLFDRFEVFYGMIYAYLNRGESHMWAPVGRFGWKARNQMSNNPFDETVAEANRQTASWGPIKAGLFGGSFGDFQEIARQFREQIISRLPWY